MSNVQKTVSFLALVNSTLGRINVNFDAETERESLCEKEYERVHSFGTNWSETYQASAISDDESDVIADRLCRFEKNFSANIVIGNAAYGFKPKYSRLSNLAARLSIFSRKLKIGAEGITNGEKCVNLAAEIGATAYILHTSLTNELLVYAAEKKVPSMVYTLCRISDSRAKAADELLQIKGTRYFERRGVRPEDIPMRLAEFSLFGSQKDLVEGARSLMASGASKVVLCPIFKNTEDLTRQLGKLSDWLE